MSEERRRFFRINDTVGVAYRVLTEEEIRAGDDDIEHPMGVMSLLSNYDSAIVELLQKLNTLDPLLEEVLTTLNKKINCVINHLELDANLVERLSHQIKEVNISACGIAFNVEEDIDVGQTLSLDISLQPHQQSHQDSHSSIHVFTYGTVVQSEAEEEVEGRYIRVNFHGMKPEDQEVLIQHIVRRQSGLLRDLREERGRLQV